MAKEVSIFTLVFLIVSLCLWWFGTSDSTPSPDVYPGQNGAEQTGHTSAGRGKKVYHELRRRLQFGSARRQPAQQLKRWIATLSEAQVNELADALPATQVSFVAWLSGLSAKQCLLFNQQVMRFYMRHQIDPTWLTEADTPLEPKVKQAIAEVALLYSIASWRMIQSQNQVGAMKKLKAFLDAPTHAGNREFAQQLFSALVRQGLAKMPAELMLAPAKQRRAHIATAIAQVMQVEPVCFYEVLYGIDSKHDVTPVEDSTSGATSQRVSWKWQTALKAGSLPDDDNKHIF